MRKRKPHSSYLGAGGRIYDPTLGRFLQADPFVQAPKNSQNLNRYSYVLNNPLSYTDPSGYFFKRFIKKWGRLIVAAVATYFTAGWASGWAATWYAAGTVANAAIAGAFAGAVGGAILTGTVEGAFWGAVSGAALGAIGASSWSKTGKVAASGATGGTVAELQGGKFGHGFISAGVGFWSGMTFGGELSLKNFFASTAVAGTVSEATGGKFGNGAVSAALSYAVNAGMKVTRKPTAEEVTYARLANDVRNPQGLPIDGFEMSGPLLKKPSGLQYASYIHSITGQEVMAFAGSNGMNDYLNSNIPQGIGFEGKQYSEAIAIAQIAAKSNPNIHFVGHSLGGGLAAAAAIVTRRTATTFNAAAVHPNTVNNLVAIPGSVTQFNSGFDVLQGVNAMTPGAYARGNQVSLGAAGLHSVSGICKAMRC